MRMIGWLPAVVATLLATTAPASAGESSGPVVSEGGISAEVTSAGSSSGGGSAGSSGGSVTGAGQAAASCPGAPGGACTNGLGWWYSSAGCYAVVSSVPPGSAAWTTIAGDATDVAIMMCVGSQSGYYFTVPAGQATIPDARQLALSAVGHAQFAVPEVHTAPSSARVSYVRLENWLWIPEDQWADVTATAAVGGTRVTAVGRPVRVEWQTGDGNVTSCFTAGRAWLSTMTDNDQTGCKHTYDQVSATQPGGVYRLTAQIVYNVTWTCSGACTAAGGDLGEYPSPSSDGCLTVNELQSVVVDRDVAVSPGKSLCPAP